ncbi:hypothetical protein ACH4JS_29340 [Streptomyces sp. NPDC017638]|uniref:hypothetical protein n=1 Tax=Streptomyces sp. NPDC017638 TaxID=3365004 RepID=UPI0037AAF899
MEFTPTKRVLSTAAVAVAALSASAGLATAGTAGAAGAAVPWSTTYGTANASGTRWTEPSGTSTALVVKGELRNTGTACYSVWVQWTNDFISYPYQKSTTQCGAGVTPVDIRLSPYKLTTNGHLKVCKGTADTSACGSEISLTTWPITIAATSR